MTATASEALTVARRVLDTHIGTAINGITITPDASIIIGVADTDVLTRASVSLKLRHVSSFVPTWAGNVDDIHVSLQLQIPTGVIPAQPRRVAS